MCIGQRIKKLRRGKMNQFELAALVGVSIDTIRRWESNKRPPRSVDLKILAEVLKTSVAYLVGETDTPEISAEIPPNRVGSPLASQELPVNESLPARDSDVFATLGTLINQLEKTYPNMTEEDQKLARGLLNRCMRIVSSDIEEGKKKEVI